MRATADKKLTGSESEPGEVRKLLKCKGFRERVKQILGHPATNRA
jgi:hypothetical protein